MSGPEIDESQAKATDISRWDKASKVVEGERVKLHRFVPSGKTIWTVVGRECDYLVDCRAGRKACCSCDDFYFRVLSGKIPECYHLMAAKRAIKEGMYAVIEHKDEEIHSFLKGLLEDLFAHIA